MSASKPTADQPVAPGVASAQAGATLERVFELEGSGLMLAAHDLARAALESGVDDDQLRYRALLNLARCNATSVALDLFQRWGLHAKGDPMFGELYARLLKDIALHQREHEAAAPAAAAYTAMWRATGKAYLGVNAAAMALLDGNAAEARALVDALGEIPDSGDYWSAATIAEAALLRGDQDEAFRWLAVAQGRAGGELAMRATTRRQLRWEAALLGADPAVIDALIVPNVLHYCGQIPTAPADESGIAAAISAAVQDIGFAYGGLAAGGDILIAEALLARGAQLHVLLPFPPDEYEVRSVRVAGESWVPRYRACLARAEVTVLEPKPHDDYSFMMASRRAMGLARLQSRQIETGVRQLAIWDGTPPRAAAGTPVDIEAWRAAGLQTEILSGPWPRRTPARPAPRPPREPRAVLFGDLPGFGKLDDAELAAFYAAPMEAVAQAIAAERPDYRNSWGDAVQCVFAHSNAAARCAMGIRAALTPDELARHHLPTSLTPRLALDYGALLPVRDPVQQVRKYAGTTMTRAARIEPVTPPGRIYATQAFACEMALEPFPAVTCDYAGFTRTAKDYGTLPLYSVRAAGRR
jgi:hypothetical protein